MGDESNEGEGRCPSDESHGGKGCGRPSDEGHEGKGCPSDEGHEGKSCGCPCDESHESKGRGPSNEGHEGESCGSSNEGHEGLNRVGGGENQSRRQDEDDKVPRRLRRLMCTGQFCIVSDSDYGVCCHQESSH